MSSNVRAIIVLVLVFAIGGVTGAAFERRFGTPAVVEGPRRRETARDHSVEVEQIPFPLQALGLSDDETRQLHAIARRWRPRAGWLVQGLRDSVSNLENDMFAEMLCVLSPDQRERYRTQLLEQSRDTTLVNRRFRLVRANACTDSLAASAAKGQEAHRR